MSEYRTATVDVAKLADLLLFACERLSESGSSHASVSFGWDSRLPIDDLWKPVAVPIGELREFIARAEQAGIFTLGTADVFIEVPGLMLTLCHESDAHISGESPLVQEIVSSWQAQGFEPYVVGSTRQAASGAGNA